ncbi:MAG: helix-turn-helix domain-containing protein [Bacteroidia bacterium]
MITDNEENNPALLASKFINHTQKNIFLTGKAGTGKTTFLKHIVGHTHKKSIIVAPTGIAAINAGGVTIHSLFQLPFGAYVPTNQINTAQHVSLKINDPVSVIKNLQMHESKRKLLRELELLIIDEVSMLRADLLDAIDMVLRYVRRKQSPFGGVQILFIGDLLQLPPVIKNEEWEFLKTFYTSIYFFDAQVLQKEKPVYIELDKIYRQADDTFISLLNNLRNNQITENDIELLNKYYQPNFKPKADASYITLTTHNYKAFELNKTFLQELKSKSYYFEAEIEDDFNEYAYPIEKTLELKKGAQVMFVKNDSTGAQRFFNGKIGVISFINADDIEVQFEDNTKLLLEKYTWENIKYKLNETTNEIEEQTVGTFTQYPIKLAWAITVHKSQGLTFDKAIIDIGAAFAPGQAYVALSRLRSLQGLVLTSEIRYNGIKENSTVTGFSKTKTEQENLNDLIKKEGLVFLKNYLLHCFDFGVLAYNVKEHVESYSKDEKKSTKQKQYSWAVALKKELDAVKPYADKFLYQLSNIIDNKEVDYLETLKGRVFSAKEYFLPVLKDCSKNIFQQVEKIKSEKKIKTYFNELLELETQFYEQTKLISKAELLVNAFLHNKEFTKEDLNSIINDKERVEQINRALTKPEKEFKKDVSYEVEKPVEKNRKGKRGETKKEKTDTKKESFVLFTQGKTIPEIASTRKMVNSTIEGHLAYYAAKGELDVTSIVSEKRIEEIISAAKRLDTFLINPIKQSLGADYSYGEIKLALASYLAK